jgi:hypothetical protein
MIVVPHQLSLAVLTYVCIYGMQNTIGCNGQLANGLRHTEHREQATDEFRHVAIYLGLP